MSSGITAINDEVQRASAFVRPLLAEMSKVVTTSAAARVMASDFDFCSANN
jgi:hypothetical protein